MRPNFEKCVRVATDLLFRQDIKGTMIDVLELTYDKNIVFDSIQNYCKLTGASLKPYTKPNGILSEGCTIYDPDSGYYIILHNDKIQCYEHLNWTRAHEVGHIYLSHTSDNSKNEIEAHYFAAQLLMPEYTIFQLRNLLGCHSVQHIYDLFNVSYEAAEKRVNTMNRKKVFNANFKDKVIYYKMKSDIDNYLNINDYPLKTNQVLTSFFDIESDQNLRKLEDIWLYGGL